MHSPIDEPTCNIRLRQDFESFMGMTSPSGVSRKRPSRLSTIGQLDFGNDDSNRFSGAPIDGSVDDIFFPDFKTPKLDEFCKSSITPPKFPSDLEHRMQEVKGLSKIAALERKVAVLQKELDEARILHDHERETWRKSKETSDAKIQSLEKNVIAYGNRTTDVQQRAKELASKSLSDHQQLKQRVEKCLQEKAAVDAQLNQLRAQSQDQTKLLRDQLLAQKTLLLNAQSEVDQNKALLKHQKDVNQRVNLQLQTSLETQTILERRAREAEHRLEEFKQDYQLAQSMQNELAELRQLRQENAVLKQNCQKYKNLSDNTFLLKEAKEQLSEEVGLLKRTHELTLTELAELKSAIVTSASSTAKANQSQRSGLDQVIGQFVPASASFYDTVDALSRKVASLIHAECSLKQRLKETSEEMAAIKRDRSLENGRAQSLLAAKATELSNTRERFELQLCELRSQFENELCKANRELETLKNVREQLKHSVTDYSRRLAIAEQTITALNAELNKEKSTCDTQTDFIEEPSVDMEMVVCETSAHVVQELVSEVEKSFCEEAEKNLRDEVDQLNGVVASLRAEIQHLKGVVESKEEINETLSKWLGLKKDYDPETERVLHFERNPLDIAHREYKNELETLRKEKQTLTLRLEEFERLRKKSEASTTPSAAASAMPCPAAASADPKSEPFHLESAMDEDDVTGQVAVRLEVAKLVKEKEDLVAQVKKVEEIKDRQRRAHSDLIQRFREISATLTGYQIKMKEGNMFQVQSVFEPHDRYFQFQRASNGELQLLDNDYIRRWTDFVDTYLATDHSFPAFLSAVTLQLYNKDSSSMMSKEDASSRNLSADEAGPSNN